MKVYAFSKQRARGGAYLAVGENIRDAMLTAERASGLRFTMGLTANAVDLDTCDTSLLSPGDFEVLEQYRAEIA